MRTEEHILFEAREIFYKKGLAGARMQEIADKAGINKAMLHYYFKSKDQLFSKVFEQAFMVFTERIAELLNSDTPLETKLSDYVNHTIDALASNPGIPVFVLNELKFNPERITDMFAGKNKIEIARFTSQVKTKSNGKIDGNNLFIDMVALCVYPFVIAPVFKKMLRKSDTQYNDMLLRRKEYIIEELLNKFN